MSDKEEILRMIENKDGVYYHQEDVCRILKRLNGYCMTLSAKKIIKESLEIFSCVENK